MWHAFNYNLLNRGDDGIRNQASWMSVIWLSNDTQNLVEEKDKKVKELQDNIAAVSFTPSSKMGKMLMAKCRTLQEENEEIGNQAAEGKVLV